MAGNTRVLQKSFSGGEVSPEMYGRVDDAKYQSGLATCRNFIAKAQGPAESRPGFAYVATVKTSAKRTRLIPFTYSTDQTMVIEMGDGYFRFHTRGAPLLFDPTVAWVTARAYLVGDLVTESATKYVCIVAHTSGVFATDLSAAKWRVLAWGTSTSYAVGGMVLQAGVYYYCRTAHTSGVFATDLAAGKWYALPATLVYEIPTSYTEDEIFDVHHVQSADVLTLVHTAHPPAELQRLGATDWVLADISFAAPISAPGAPSVTPSPNPHATLDYTYSYVVTAIMADGVRESAASLAGTCQGNLFAQGNTLVISWIAVSGASRYRVYKLQGGIYGYIGQTTGTSIVDDNIAPDLAVTPPIYDSVFGSITNYPGAVSYFEQRRVFAGTVAEPQKLWMTKSGTESAMSYSLPIRDDDRIAIRVAAREVNAIRHVVPLSQLLLLTSAAEWRVTSLNSDAITPTSIAVAPQSYVGTSNVQPIIVNANMIHVAARGGHVRECSYNFQANGFITGDLSLRAAHLFDTLTIADMAFSKAPYSMVWFVSSNGKLLGLTYVPEQQVGAWHQHDTVDGTFESVACVSEDNEDRLYVVVKRTINGAPVRYVERMASRAFTRPEDAFFVDAGVWRDRQESSVGTMTLTSTSWSAGDPPHVDASITITASVATFVTGSPSTDIGDAIVITVDDVIYTLRITAVASTTSATAVTDKIIPVGMRDTPLGATTWAFARDTVTGLDHLEGETVNVLIDGAVHPPCVVGEDTPGAITLQTTAVVSVVGLPITADIETLPLIMQTESALGQGRVKNVNHATLRVFRSSGVFIGPDEDHLVEFKQRTTEAYGVPPDLKSDEIRLVLTPAWASGGSVFVRQSDPLPLTITNLILDVSVGG